MNITFENSVTGRLLSSISDASSVLDKVERSKVKFIHLSRSTIAFWRLGDTAQFAVSTRKLRDRHSDEIGDLWAFEQLMGGNYCTMAWEDFEDIHEL